MFGGTSHGESPAKGRAASAAEHPSTAWTWLAPLLPVLVALTVGSVLASGLARHVSAETLDAGRQVLLTAGGALWFGAGLLQIVTSRICCDPAKGSRGGAVACVGLSIAFATSVPLGWPTLTSTAHATLTWPFASSVLWAGVSVLVLATRIEDFFVAAEEEDERANSAEQALRSVTDTSIERQLEQRELRHDARNALCALRIATQTLAQIGDQLDGATRGQLRGSMLEEVGNLEDLISRTAPRTPGLDVAKGLMVAIPQQRPARRDQPSFATR